MVDDVLLNLFKMIPPPKKNIDKALFLLDLPCDDA